MREEEQTCGKGVAANAALPDGMGALLGAVADVLDNHMRSLNAGDAAGAQELAAYRNLVTEHRAAAATLQALAETMRGYRDLPVAPHEMAPLMDAASVDVMAAFVRAEEELVALLQQRVAEHWEMLRGMRGG